MLKGIILPLAKKDILDAAQWYQKKQPGLWKKFTGEVREKVKFIGRNPIVYFKRYDDVRTAVLHTSRNPDIWKNR